jgi:hypothetical protein
MSLTAGINCWIDAMNTGSIATSGTRTVGSNTYNVVTTITDQSTAGRNLTVPGGTTGPIIVPSLTSAAVTDIKSGAYAVSQGDLLANNKPAFVFRGRQTPYHDSLTATLGNTAGVTPMAMFTVVQDWNDGCLFGSADSGNVYFHYSNYYTVVNDANGRGVDNRSTSKSRYTGPVLNSFYSTTVSGTNYVNVKFNGTSYGSHSTGSSNFMSWNNLRINGRTNGETTEGTVHEVICYNRVLTVDETIEIEGYLASKWGLQYRLPAGHKYKSTVYPYTTLGNSGMDNYSGGAAGDPYVTTFSNISYKLPTLDAPIRYFQTMEGGKLLTINAQLKTVERSGMEDDTLRSLIVLRNKMTTAQYTNIIQKLMKPEVLCFFERVSIQHGDQRLVVNLWESKFDVVENTLRCGAEKVERPDLLKKAGGIYSGYKADTIKLTIGSTAIYLSVYNSPMIRNGISVESGTLKGANGVVVNALSASAMTLRSLASTEPVATRDSLKAITKVETFVDHEGVRSRNIVTYK